MSKIEKTKIKNNKNHVISFRVTDEQYLDILMRTTDENGKAIMKPGEFAKASILASTVNLISKELKDLEQYKVFILARMGNNINQLVKRLNTDNKSGKLDLDTYIEILEELKKIQDEQHAMLVPVFVAQ